MIKVYGFNLYLIYFLIYSFLGWLWEEIFCTIDQGKLVNRGFLFGPLCPIYGTGALAVDLLFRELMQIESYILLFVVSMVVCTVIEYCTAVILEKLFNTRWWDYSDYKINFQGRISLLASTAFGAMSVILVKFVHPFVVDLLSRVDHGIINYIGGICLGVFVADVIMTVKSIIVMQSGLETVSGKLSEFLEQNKERINSALADGKTKTGELKDNLMKNFRRSKDYNDQVRKFKKSGFFSAKRLIKAFPYMKNTKYSKLFDTIKSDVEKEDDENDNE